MRVRSLVFWVVLILLLGLMGAGLSGRIGDFWTPVWTGAILIVTGAWIVLMRRMLRKGEAAERAQPPAVQPAAPGLSAEPAAESGIPARVPRVRREKAFFVEENVDALRWPEECSWCGGTVEQRETLRLKGKFKGRGRVEAEVAGIPYCRQCAGRARRTGRLNSVVIVLGFGLGIVLGLFVLWQVKTGRSDTNVLSWAMAFGLCLAIGYGIVWLLVKLPAKLLLRKRLAEPVDGWLTEEKQSSGREGVSVVLTIPNKRYADKFAQMNVAPEGLPPVPAAH